MSLFIVVYIEVGWECSAGLAIAVSVYPICLRLDVVVLLMVMWGKGGKGVMCKADKR